MQVCTHLVPSIKLYPNKEMEYINNVLYARPIGSLMYVMVYNRLDILYVVNMVASTCIIQKKVIDKHLNGFWDIF